jgi:O-antigen/teichoic acid export membrane protein
MANGAFWSLSGALLSRGLALVSSIIIARFLGAKGYGEFGIIQSTIGMFGMFAGLGLGMTATKYIAQYRDTDKEKTENIIALTALVASITSAIVSILLFYFSGWLATKTLAAPHLSSILQIGALYLFFLSIIGLQNGILAGFEAFKVIAIRSVIAAVSTFPLMVGGVYFFGIQGAVWGLVGSSLINVVLNYLAIQKIFFKNDIKINIKNCIGEKYILHEFALPAFLAGVMVGPVNWICNTILINQPNGYSEMGIYNAANQLMLIILFVPGTLATIILPMLTNLNQDSNAVKYSRMLKYNIILNILIASIISLGIIIFSRLIMSTYGASFSGGQSVLIILALTAILVSYNSVIGQAIASKGKMWIGFILNLMWAIILILITYLYTKNGGGAFGFAKANFYAYFFLSLITTLILKFHKR